MMARASREYRDGHKLGRADGANGDNASYRDDAGLLWRTGYEVGYALGAFLSDIEAHEAQLADNEED